jgi:acyl-CoA synthetase (NDP forming)
MEFLGMIRPTREELAAFFRPRNIALVGASDKSAWSTRICSRFGMFGHEGRLYAVNRSGSPAHGLPGFTSIGDIPERVDMAYIYTPASAVADAVRQAGAAGIRNVVVLSSGFAETGEDGARLQAELAAAAEEAGVIMLGPNSLGFANIADRCVCTSMPTRQPVRSGRLGIVSQSGAVANELAKFAHTQGIGVSFIGATGNEAHLGIADLVEYLVDDPGTGAIALYVEAINDPPRFVEAAARARQANKPVAVIKLGRSAVSAAVAQAHTGSLVGDDKAFDAMCRRYGVIRASSIEELILTASFIEKVGPISPPRIALASVSGGACGMYADLAEMHGLATPQFTERTKAALREALPGFAATLNPLDVTGATLQDPKIWPGAVAALLADPGIGLVVASTVLPNTPTEVEGMGADIRAMVAGYRAAGKPPVACGMSLQERSDVQREFLKEVGLEIVLPNLEFAVRALAHLQRWSERPVAAPPTLPKAAGTTRPSSEREVLAHLAAHGAPVIPAVVARTAEEAAKAAEALGVPAVLKIASPDIVHKTEAGGVRLNVSGAAAARTAYEDIKRAVSAHAPSAQIDGVIVSPMREQAVELIVGVARDVDWGPVIVAGLGGIFTEALKDSQVRMLPIDAAEARSMLTDLRGAKVLEGFRGAPPADLDKLAEVIVAIGDAALALGPELAALEVNPLRVSGGEVECLDGVAVYAEPGA